MKLFCLLSTSCLDHFMLVLMLMSGTLVLNHISVKNCDVNIKFFHQNGPSAQFFRPSLEEACWISIHNIIAKVDPPLCGSTGRFYCLDFDEMNCIKKLM